MMYLIVVNVIGFFLCFLDKKLAVANMYRIPEVALLLISLFGGCFLFLFGMHMFHHKTKKVKFKAIYFFCFMWLYLIYKIYIY